MTMPSRPDIEQMRSTLPTPDGPSSVQMQAAAQAGPRDDSIGIAYVEYDGDRWYLSRLPDMFDLGELGEAIDQAEQNPIAALGAINRCLREWLFDYPGLRARFRRAGGDMDDYVRIATGLFEAVVARPTDPPADSSAGPTSTSTSSKDAAPSTEPPNPPPPAIHG